MGSHLASHSRATHPLTLARSSEGKDVDADVDADVDVGAGAIMNKADLKGSIVLARPPSSRSLIGGMTGTISAPLTWPSRTGALH